MSAKYVEISKLAKSLNEVAYCNAAPDSAYSEGFRAGLRKSVRMLRDEPSADVVPVIHARWLPYPLEGRFTLGGECSNCGNCPTCVVGMNYCWNCGARMDEKEESV